MSMAPFSSQDWCMIAPPQDRNPDQLSLLYQYYYRQEAGIKHIAQTDLPFFQLSLSDLIIRQLYPGLNYRIQVVSMN